MMLLLLACADPEDTATVATDTAADVVDDRLGEDDVPAIPEGGERWYGPDVVIEPGQEVQYCTFGTYTGPDVGIVSFDSYQGSVGHHLILLGTSATTIDYADGETVDCTRTNTMMTSFEPLINAEPIDAGRASITLPEGMAVKLNQGQRWVVQSHYVNTTTDRIRERDIMNIGFTPEDSVDVWAAAFALTQVNLSLPPAQASSLSFDCSFDEPYQVMYLTGHMHEWGTSFSFDYGDGVTMTESYAIPEWDPRYRDAPPLNHYEEGEFAFEAGATLRTNCNWFNDTDETLEFPNEMCATYGMLYPSEAPVVCSD
ncbi:hypothetical protein LBMAG42_48700 [Deltaproteobacteria bacterium]|nr:hypothetical protein LBMAG42_48700 [Deltaproteobacteria bacterium]